ncbi:Nucleoside-diphosphate-sugar epimerase [Haladaptatus litoreus]|uniref:Nucleoside-diphosphate-sugar epimerase n=1 Tax=Haladaptatus litoreus TaxID=553468 RepID=A0A1N6WN17_9EURY|nr:SDR family oxidoreductase [Haladaptatus litoreus]SIQ91461.1 Nucleoside-diphosphate-sugar epimerase [Haladaptatus litoreus]
MNVAILGCGYVGLQLGRQSDEDGHDVVGVRRSADGVQAIEDAGFGGIQADATDEKSLSAIPDVDALVYAVSAGGRDSDSARSAYVNGLRTTLSHFSRRDSPPERVVYTSSTGVYGDRDGDWVDESTPLEPKTERQEILVEAERIAREEHEMDWTIARFAGLYGPDRYRLERYLDGTVAERYLNLIHRDDAAGAVRFLLESDSARNETVLVCDDEPIWKPTLAEWLAEQCGVEGPERGDATSERARSSKRCSNEKLRDLGYEFRYPTYREGYRNAISEYRQPENV